MRTPWRRLAPGMVRVPTEELIGLLRGALRAAVLEAEGRALDAQADAYRRETRARAVVDEQSAAAGVSLRLLEVNGLVAHLPQTEHGALHEPAFLALLGQHFLERRLGDSIPTTREDHR